VAYTCNLSYSGDRDWEDDGLRLAWVKSSETPTHKKLGVVVHAPVIQLLGRLKWEDHSAGWSKHKLKNQLKKQEMERTKGVH
jgi:hypothetical protein